MHFFFHRFSEKIGDEWPVHLDQLQQLKRWADDPSFQR